MNNYEILTNAIMHLKISKNQLNFNFFDVILKNILNC